MPLDTAPAESLTARQFEILRLVAKGYSNPEISRLLSISVNTVKVHVAGILESLKVSNRTEAASLYTSLLQESEVTSKEARTRAQVTERIGAPAICVVPFQEQPPSEDFFAEGLVEDLILRLSAWRWFPVVASGASRAFDPKSMTLRDFGEKVGATYVISGSLRRAGSRARISVAVNSAKDGRVIWSESFDRDLLDLLAIQDEISRLIVARIAPELLGIESKQMVNLASPPVDAWRLAIAGFAHISRRERDRFQHAIASFDAAIRIDPEFGMAHYGRAHAWYLAIVEQWVAEPSEAQRHFVESTQSAMKYDPASAGSQMMCALSMLHLGKLDAAFSHISQAVAINPSHCLALGVLGQLQVLRGVPERAFTSLEEALRLGPRDPGAWLHHATSAFAHFALGQFEEGIESSNHSIHLRPDSALPRIPHIACQECAGHHQVAVVAADDLKEKHPNYRLSPLLRLMQLAPRETFEKLKLSLLNAGLPI